MSKFGVVYGHGEVDPGAGDHGFNERDFLRNQFNQGLRKYASMLKNNTIVFYDASKNMYYESQRGRGAYSFGGDCKSITELHLDSAGPNATGGHVIISAKYAPDTADLAIAEVVKKNVGWWAGVASKRGINQRNDLLNLNIYQDRGISYRLVELGFISNRRDIDTILVNMDSYCKGLIEAITGEKIIGKVDSVVSKPTPTPTPKPTPKPTPTPAPKPNTSTSNAKGTFTLGQDINLRTGASTSSSLIATLGKGSVIKFDQKINSGGYVWLRQPRGNGYGYLASGEVGKTPWGSFSGGSTSKPSTSTSKPTTSTSKPTTSTSNAKGTFILGQNINLRTGANTGSSLIATLPKGSAVKFDQKINAGGYVWLRQPRGNGYGYLASGQIGKTPWGTFK